GLSGTVRPEQAVHLALRHAEADARQCLQAPEGLDDCLDLDRVLGAHASAPSGPSSSTKPLVASTVTRCPVRIAVVAAGTPTTAGMPYSRATIEPWDIMTPISMTSAPEVMKRGDQQGCVNGVNSNSPGYRWLYAY